MVPLYIIPYFLKDEVRIWRPTSKTYSCLKNQHKYSLYFVCKLFLAWSQSKQWAQWNWISTWDELRLAVSYRKIKMQLTNNDEMLNCLSTEQNSHQTND